MLAASLPKFNLIRARHCLSLTSYLAPIFMCLIRCHEWHAFGGKIFPTPMPSWIIKVVGWACASMVHNTMPATTHGPSITPYWCRFPHFSKKKLDHVLFLRWIFDTFFFFNNYMFFLTRLAENGGVTASPPPPPPPPSFHCKFRCLVSILPLENRI